MKIKLIYLLLIVHQFSFCSTSINQEELRSFQYMTSDILVQSYTYQKLQEYEQIIGTLEYKIEFDNRTLVDSFDLRLLQKTVEFSKQIFKDNTGGSIGLVDSLLSNLNVIRKNNSLRTLDMYNWIKCYENNLEIASSETDSLCRVNCLRIANFKVVFQFFQTIESILIGAGVQSCDSKSTLLNTVISPEIVNIDNAILTTIRLLNVLTIDQNKGQLVCIKTKTWERGNKDKEVQAVQLLSKNTSFLDSLLLKNTQEEFVSFLHIKSDVFLNNNSHIYLLADVVNPNQSLNSKWINKLVLDSFRIEKSVNKSILLACATLSYLYMYQDSCNFQTRTIGAMHRNFE